MKAAESKRKEASKLGWSPNIIDFRKLWNKISGLWESEKSEPRLIKITVFFFLGILGFSWIPFYPYWMVIILSLILAAISSKFPYISLLLLGLFVGASASYQTPEFGFFLLAAILLILVASLFDWKFGFLVFMAIFLSKFGLSFIVPIMAVMLYTTFMGIAIAITSGMVLIFIVTCGNFDVSSFIVGAQGTTGFIIFSNPIKPDFIPTDIGSALINIKNADGSIMADIIGANLGASVAPYLQLMVWCFSVYISSYIRPSKGYENLKKLKNSWLFISFSAAILILLSFLISYVALGYELTLPVLLVSLCIIPIVLLTTASCIMLRWEFKDYFARQLEVIKGARIASTEEVHITSFKDVGGLSDIKEDVRDSILLPLLKTEVAEHYGVYLPKGILLFGPPGCGKTLLMKALANELHMEMLIIKCSDLMSKWYGESESRIEQLFKEARERKPCIIFLDDIDTIARSRDLYSADDVTPRLLGLILSELDGMTAGSDMIVVGSTNKPEVLDSAILRPGRFDKIIYIPPPDLRERIEILKIHLKGKPAKTVDTTDIAEKTEGFSGADLANLTNEAAVSTMKSALRTGKSEEITTGNFTDALRSIKPSITSPMLNDYEQYKQKFERKLLRGPGETGEEEVGK